MNYFKIRIIKVADDYYSLRILEQNNFSEYETKSFRLTRASYPDIGSTKLLVRGVDSSRNYIWTSCFSHNTLSKLITCLTSYTKYNNTGIQYEIDGNSFVLIIGDGGESKLDTNYKKILKSLKNTNGIEYDSIDVQCCDCGGHNNVKYHNSLLGSKYLCNECIKNVIYCDSCNKLGYSDNIIIVKSRDGNEVKLCNNCRKTFNCISCGEKELLYSRRSIIYLDHQYNTITNNKVCSLCTKDYNECSRCSYYYKEAKCPCTYPEDFVAWINKYNYDVTSELMFDIGTELYGLELEVGVHRKYRESYKSICDGTKKLIGNDGRLVFDSSIDYLDRKLDIKNTHRGFEIVTRPLCYQNAYNFIRSVCENKHDLIKSWEVGTTGVHIHVSKKCLSRIEIGKLVYFINNKNNKNLITYISKRENNKFAKFVPTKKITNYADKYPDCHYEILNTMKPNTIEFRMFKGTLNKFTLISYLQFVKSMVEFVRVSSISELTEVKYLEWLNKTCCSKFRELKTRLFKMSEDYSFSEEGEI